METITETMDDITPHPAAASPVVPPTLTLREMVWAITEDLPHDRQPPRTLDAASDLLADYFVHGGDGEQTDRYNETMSTPAGWQTERDARHLALAWHSEGIGNEGARGEGLPRNICTMILEPGGEPPVERMLPDSEIRHDTAGGKFARTRTHKDAMERMVAEVITRAEGTHCDYRVAGKVVLVGGLGASTTGWVEVRGTLPASSEVL